MKRPKTLPAFTVEEYHHAHRLLAARVVSMMGRKFEEGDWAYVYCTTKNIPLVGWSNLNIDVIYNGLGVEHKMLSRPTESRLKDTCGTRLMHPAATRSIRIPSLDKDPNEVMRDVLTQYADLIQQRRDKVAETNPDHEPDLRTGWLLWQSNLREFLYFEEEMLIPDPDDYYAEWKESGGGSRKTSKNLWVYETDTGQKRYSITTSAGAKIQPYFDVPPPNDPNLYLFRVQGEELQNGLIRIWIAASTERELRRVIGDVDVERLSTLILETARHQPEMKYTGSMHPEAAIPVMITVEAYETLNTAFPGVSDEHMMQLLIHHLQDR